MSPGATKVERLRSVGLVVGLVAATALFLWVVHRHEPIGGWLLLRYLRAGAWASLFGLAALSSGYAVVRRLWPAVSLSERLVVGFGVGLVLFFLAWFGVGLAGLFHPLSAVLLPTALIALGARPLVRDLRRVARGMGAGRPPRAAARSNLERALLLAGFAAIGLLWLATLNPKNASFDTIWYHLGLGEQFAAVGGIARTGEGAYVATLPPMTAVLFSWAFQLPGAKLFDIVETAAHQEVLIFLVTLASIPLLVRWLVPGRRQTAAWVALFLFPAIFTYDAALVVGSDHVAAFWAVPIALVLRRAFRSLDVPSMALLAVFCAAAVLTKYQTASLVVGPLAAIAARFVWLVARTRSVRGPSRGVAVAVAIGLLVSAPHWAKNWAWYGDPLYPALHKRLTLAPWNEDAAAYQKLNWKRLVWRPEGTLPQQLAETAAAGFTFSFRAHARKQFHGERPVFGSLFTLSLLWLPLLRRTRRLWALWAMAQAGVFAWYWISHVERYLQALVPWMAAVVAGGLVLLWREGRLARAGVVALVLAQVAWGLDAIALPTHAMLGDSPIRAAFKLFSTGFDGREAERDAVSALQGFATRLPGDARVLLHEQNPRLGLGREVVTDMPGFQGRISWGRASGDAEVQALLRSLGVTHVLAKGSASRGLDSLAGDLRFFGWLHRHGRPGISAGGFTSFAVPEQLAEPRADRTIAWFGCGRTFSRGLYDLPALHVISGDKRKVPPRTPIAADTAAERAAIAEADGVVLEPKCAGQRIRAAELQGFTLVATRKDSTQLWLRAVARQRSAPETVPSSPSTWDGGAPFEELDPAE